MKNHLTLILVIIACKFLYAFGAEGTNPSYNMPYDVTIEKLKLPNIATGNTSGHKLLVKADTGGWVREMPLYTGSTGISINGSNLITNTSPDQTVTLTSGSGITITGTYPNFTVSKTKKDETNTGTTNASGVFTYTFTNTYSVAPNVQATLINGTDTQILKVGTPTTTSVTITVRNRVDALGLLPTYQNVNGAVVDLQIKEK